MNGAQWLVAALAAEGVDHVFGYPGGAIMPFYDALYDAPFIHILSRHEQGSAFAANGYARASGRVGVCVSTSGPGATNLITGMADAMLDSVPMVVITGQVASALLGTDAFQEVDVLGMTLPIVKHSFLVRDINDLPEVVREAFTIARTGRPGPVVIDLPKDVQLADATALPAHQPAILPATPQPNAASLQAALDALAHAQRPVVYGGGGIVLGDAVAEFRRFVDATQLPTVLTLKALGALPDQHPLLLGMLGMHGSRAANLAMQACDVMLVVGARFDDRATGKLDEFAPGAKVIHLDLDPAEFNKLRRADVAVHGDLRSSLDALAVATSECDAWRASCVQHKHHAAHLSDASDDAVCAPSLLQRLSELVPNAVVSCDVGQHQMWVAQHWRFNDPRKHLTSGALGAMGFGLPAALGAQLACPDVPVVCVSGDGSFLMNVQELATLARYQLPVKIVLLDNQRLGLVRQWQELFFEQRFSQTDLSDNPDFVALAQSFGITAWHVERRDGVEPALHQLLATPGPALLHVTVDVNANVWPLVPPNRNNAEMVHGMSHHRTPTPSHCSPSHRPPLHCENADALPT